MAQAKKVTTKKKTEKAEVKEVSEATPAVEGQPIEEAKQVTKTTAKAGKRSEKALKEAEEKLVKEERKAHRDEEQTAGKPKKKVHPAARPRLERHSKAYRKAAELIDRSKDYGLADALDLATKTSTVKFNASVELHVNLGVDPKQADQNIRQTVALPAGTGKTARIAVFADADDVIKAKKAGADIAAGDEFLLQLDKGTINFDVLIATPAMMSKLGKYARLLGPKGLMPNPKSGTVTPNVTKAVTEAKSGRVEYRVDSTGIIHTTIGKVSFGKDKLTLNAQAVLDSIKAAKPASIKGSYVLSVFVTTAMGPSIQVQSGEVSVQS